MTIFTNQSDFDIPSFGSPQWLILDLHPDTPDPEIVPQLSQTLERHLGMLPVNDVNGGRPMPTDFLNNADFQIPRFNSNSQTLSFVVDVHAGVGGMIKYVIDCERFPFRDRDAVIRWCVAWGLYALLEKPPDAAALAAAKHNLLQEDQFWQRQDRIAISVEKYLAAGEPGLARRLVEISLEEYSQIPNEYWRMRSLSTLTVAIEILQARGINLRHPATKNEDNRYAAD